MEGNAPAITHVVPDEMPPQDTLSMDLAVGNQNALLEKIPEGSGVNFTPRLLCLQILRAPMRKRTPNPLPEQGHAEAHAGDKGEMREEKKLRER